MERSRFLSLFKALLFSYVLTGLLLLLLALALYKFHLKESQVSIGVNAIYILACLFGGFLTGKAVKQRRFFWGLCVGVLYFTFLTLAAFVMNRALPSDTMQTVMNLVLCVGSAGLGGMLS